MRKLARMMSIGALGLAACGHGGGAVPAATPTHGTTLATTTPTPSATPVPNPSALIQYRLGDGSMILYSPPPPKTTPIVQAPLSGTLALMRFAPPASPPPNTLFIFTIQNLMLDSLGFTVIGTGNISLLTIPIPFALRASLTGMINGQPVQLGGGGLYDGGNPPPLRNLELCGGAPDHAVSCENVRAGTEVGYILTIFAAPET